MTTASDAWMSIFERCFLNPVFFGNAANIGLRRSLNGERADMPENIVVAWSLRFPRYATATGTPESHLQCGPHCYALPYVSPIGAYVCSGK